ncbi:MAG: sigma-70 family RNA polymerase sigma factor [Acidobacteria bacterium]|nr:sigma-70 family RNA polymerase sigma factor [Acidobacteriota bacterium]
MAIDRDLELMLGVRRGDASSFEELLHRYRGPLVGYFSRMLRDPAMAEDLAQETFMRVYQSRERYEPEAKFTTWLYRIATNLALNALRDRKETAPREQNGHDGETTEPQTSKVADTNPTAEQELMETERQEIIRRAVESLPERQRAAVILHKYQDVDYRQIAKVLGVSESAVKSMLFRAYETLRLKLAPLLEEGRL